MADRNEPALRKAIIRLAHENPSLRPHLLPLVKGAALDVRDKASAQRMIKRVEDEIKVLIQEQDEELKSRVEGLERAKKSAEKEHLKYQKDIQDAHKRIGEIETRIAHTAKALVRAKSYFKYDERNIQKDRKAIVEISRKGPSKWSKADQDYLALNIAWKLDLKGPAFLEQLEAAAALLPNS